jgi:lysozyme family protein
MADFLNAFNIVVSNNTLNDNGFEGIYSNDPTDMLTVYGLEQRDDSAWQSWPLVLKTVNTSQSDTWNAKAIIGVPAILQSAQSFHKATYWDKMKLDAVNEQVMANELYSAGLNIGLSTASKMFQQVLNCMGANIAADGLIGSKTIAAYNSITDKKQVLKRYAALHLSYYTNLGANSNQNGWFNRVVGVSGI